MEREKNVQTGFGCRTNLVDLMCSAKLKEKSISNSQSLAERTKRMIIPTEKTGWRAKGMTKIWELVFIVKIKRFMRFEISAKYQHRSQADGCTCLV